MVLLGVVGFTVVRSVVVAVLASLVEELTHSREAFEGGVPVLAFQLCDIVRLHDAVENRPAWGAVRPMDPRTGGSCWLEREAPTRGGAGGRDSVIL